MKLMLHVTTTVSVLNICLDPLVYFFLSKAFRAQVRQRTLSRRKRPDVGQMNKESESSEEAAEQQQQAEL